MRESHRYFIPLIALICIPTPGWAQLGMFSKEQRLELTREWQGGRFPDGRPKVLVAPPLGQTARLSTPCDVDHRSGALLRGCGSTASGFEDDVPSSVESCPGDPG